MTEQIHTCKIIQTIEFDIKNLEFGKLINYIKNENDEDTKINKLAECLCLNYLQILKSIIEKCNEEKQKINTNTLKELCIEMVAHKKETVLLYIKDFILLLYNVILHFDKIEVDTIKELYHIFLTLSYHIIIFYEEKEFLQNIFISLIKNLNRTKNCYGEFASCLRKKFLDFYCFLNLTNFLFFQTQLIYLLDTTENSGTKEKKKKIQNILNKINNFFDILFVKNETDNLYASTHTHVDTCTNTYTDVPTSIHTSVYTPNNRYEKGFPLFKTKLENETKVQIVNDTIQNREIKAVFKKLHFSILYKDIQNEIDETIFILKDGQYSQNEWDYVKNGNYSNYNSKNICINRFLFLLKALSPPFLDWGAEKEIDEEAEEISDDIYSLHYIYLLNEMENKDYLRETNDFFFFFFFHLLSLHTSEILKQKEYAILDFLFDKTLNNFYKFFCELYECKEEIHEQNYVCNNAQMKKLKHESTLEMKCESKYESKCESKYESKCESKYESKYESKCESKYESKYESITESKKATCMIDVVTHEEQKEEDLNEVNYVKTKSDCYLRISSDSHFCNMLFLKVKKTPNNFLSKLKALVIWGYIPTYHLETLHFHNSNYSYIKNKEEVFFFINFTTAIKEFFFTIDNMKQKKEKNLFFFDYKLFQSTYELKRRTPSYRNLFSKFISQLILNDIYLLISLLNIFSDTQHKETEKVVCLVDVPTLSRETYKDGETNIKDKYTTSRENDLEQIGISILQKYFHIHNNNNNNNMPIKEILEQFFFDLLYICCTFLNCPVKSIQKKSVLCIAPIMKKINIDKHHQYFDKQSDVLLTLIEEEISICNEIIESYILLKCKITKEINLNFIKAIEKLLNMALLKLPNKMLCSTIGTHMLKCFYYHPTLFPFVIYKYINLLFHLIECNQVEIVQNSLKCLFVLHKTNAEEMKNYYDDTVYRLYLLFNIFSPKKSYQTFPIDSYFGFSSDCYIDTSTSSMQKYKSRNIISGEIHSILKNCFFSKSKIKKNEDEILTLIRLILYSIRPFISEDEYKQRVHIFERCPKQFTNGSKNLQCFTTL